MIVGGASRLRGVAGFFADALGVPVETVATVTAAFGAVAASTDIGAVAIGAVLDGASGKPMFDLRQGALAFKVDLSFLRAKAGRSNGFRSCCCKSSRSHRALRRSAARTPSRCASQTPKCCA